MPLLQGLDPAVKADYDLLDTTTEQVTLQGHWSPSDGLHLVFGLDTAWLKARKTPIAGLHSDREDSASGGFLSLDWTLGPAPLGNLNLQPESVDNLEFGYRKTGAAWSLDLTAYRMSLRKAIGPEPTGLLVGTPPNTFPQTRFQNGKATLTNQGLEAALRGEPSPGWQVGFNANAVDFKDEAGRQQFYSPRFRANLWSRYRLEAFQAYVALQHLGSYRIVSQADIAGPQEERPARLQLHFNLGYDLGPHLQVALYGINATRPSDESTAGSINSGHLIRFSSREVGIQISYRY